jgi:hypothetical protein
MGPPTLAGFTAWVRAVMGVDPKYLPDGAPALAYAFQVALLVVNPAFQKVPASPGLPRLDAYTLMVYNLGGHNLIAWAPDQAGVFWKQGVDPSEGDPGAPPVGYFDYLRTNYGLNTFVAGVIQASADEGTSSSYLVPEAFKELQISDLDYLKTPWGRTYLGWAQRLGTNWGLT